MAQQLQPVEQAVSRGFLLALPGVTPNLDIDPFKAMLGRGLARALIDINADAGVLRAEIMGTDGSLMVFGIGPDSAYGMLVAPPDIDIAVAPGRYLHVTQIKGFMVATALIGVTQLISAAAYDFAPGDIRPVAPIPVIIRGMAADRVATQLINLIMGGGGGGGPAPRTLKLAVVPSK